MTTEISYRHGDTSTYLLTITDDEGNEVDLSAGELVVTAKARVSDAEPVFVKTVGAGIVLSEDPVNEAVLTIGPDDVADVDNTWVDLQADARFWRDEDGGQTPIRFVVRVKPSIGAQGS